MKTIGIRAVAPLAALLLAGAARVLAQDAPKKEEPAPVPAEPKAEPSGEKTSITLTGEVKTADDQTSFDVQGTTVLPTNTLILGHLRFNDAQIADARAIVRDNQFAMHFGPWKKVVLPGKYDVKIELPREIQHPDLKAQLEGVRLEKDSLALDVGDKTEAERTLLSVKKKMFDIAEAYRLAYVGLNSAGSYYRGEMHLLLIDTTNQAMPPAKKEAMQKLRAERLPQIQAGWRETTNAYWNDRFKTARFDWRVFREQILACPYPDAEASLAQLERNIEAWYKGMTRALYRLAGKEPPAEFLEGPAFEPQQLEKSVVDAARSVYQGLGYEQMPSFTLNDLSKPETGVVNGDWYKSYTTKFTIRKPSDWLFHLGAGNKPGGRLRIVPPETGESGGRSKTLVVVEILDFIYAKDHHHLAQLARETNRNRWRGGKEIASKEIKAHDPTMPGSVRPGLDTEFTISDGRYNLHGRYYQLFCRWHKRTYGVLCLTPDTQWEAMKAVFAKPIDKFRVLDAPEYHNLQEAELRKQAAAEKRDFDAIMKKMHAWEAGEDVPSERGAAPPAEPKKP